MALKTRPNDASVREFVDSVEDERRRSDCRTVMKIMREAAGKRARMWGPSLIGYGAYRYTNTTRKPEQWPLVAVSPRKRELVVYIMPGFSKYGALLDALGTHRKGVSCLYLKSLEAVHMPTLKRLIRRSVGDMKRSHEVV